MKVEQARRILGDKIKHLTDKEVEEFIHCSSALVEVILDMFEVKQYERRK